MARGPKRVVTLRAKIQEWQDGLASGGKRVLGIVGPPGVGKSFTLEHLKSEQVAASHFFHLGSGSLQECFSSLADQIGLTSIGESTHERNEGEDAKTLFRRILCNPLHQLSRPEKGEKFIILDAIDEADDMEMLVEIVEETWEKEMPSWLGLLFSSRPIASFTNVLSLRYDSKSSDIFKADIESFARSRLSELNLTGNRELEEGVKLIVKQSAGFVVHAHELLVHRLQEHETVGLQDLSDLVADGKFCDDIFRSYFSRLLNRSLNGDHDLYQRVLSILAVARFPIDQNTLVTLLEDEDSEKMLRKAISEVLVIDVKRGVSFPHDSMRKFLLDRKRAGKMLHIKERSGHEQIVAWLLRDETSPLSLQFLIFHLCKANQWEKVRELLLNVDWLHAVVACPEAMETMVQDAHALYIEKDVADADAVDVVLAVSLGMKHLTLEPDLLGFELNGRIANRSNPIFRSLSSSKLVTRLSLDKSFVPVSACLEHPHSSRRILAIARGSTLLATNSTLLASFVSVRGVVRVWDWAAGVCLGELEYRNLLVKLIAVDGDIVAVGYNDDLCVRVFAWRTGVCLHVLEGHGDDITCLSVQGDLVASGSRDKTMRLWSTTTGLCLHVLHHSRILQSLAFDGKLLVSIELAANVNVWDCTTGELLKRVEVNLGTGAESVGILGDVVITISNNLGMVQVWDWRNDVCLHELEGHSGFITSVAIGDGVLLSGAEDGTVRVWDLQTGACLHVLEGHFSTVNYVKLYRDSVVSFSAEDEVARVWHLPLLETSAISDENTVKYTASEILSLKQTPYCPTIAFSLSGERFASGRNRPSSNSIVISDLQTGTVHRTLQGPPGSENLAVGFFGDSVAAVFSNPGCVRVWNAESGEMIREFGFRAGVLRAGHSKEISCAAMDEHILVTGSKGTSVCVWDMTKGRCLKLLKGKPPTSTVVLTIHGNTVVSGSKNDDYMGPSKIHVWNWKLKRCEHVLDVRGKVTALAVNDSWIVAGDVGGVVIWDRATGVVVGSGHTLYTIKMRKVLSLSIWKDAIYSVDSDRILRRWTQHETVQQSFSQTVVGAFDEDIGCIAAQEIDGQLCFGFGGSARILLREIT